MSDKKTTYREHTDMENTLKLRQVLATLPPFCKDYFRAIDTTTTAKTRISYAYDIRIFFQFLLDENPAFKDHAMTDFTVDVLDQIKAVDLEEYQEYLKLYQSGDKTETNGERGLKRKISALRSFYAYYYKREMIHTNPTVLIDVPKIHEKSIIRLDTDEVAMLLDYIEHCGDTLTGQKRVFYEKTKERDLAIVTLLLGTGIRVSECVGLDLKDVDFKNNGITVTRKGGNQMVVYFGDEVAGALENYITGDREAATPLSGHEQALFLSTQRKRMGVQAVENMVKKYARQPVIMKLSPNVTDITEMARAAEAGGADVVSLINTITGMKIDINRRTFALANKTGGMSGPAVKPVAVRMVYQVAQAVNIPIIGMGGISCAEDAIEFLLAGASAVSVGTANFHNPAVTLEVIDGIEAYMKKNGFENVKDMVGIVK